MAEDILITCHSISFADGYPVLRKVFRHLAVTPKQLAIWIETEQPRVVHLLVQYSDGRTEHYGDLQLRGAGQDHFVLRVPRGFEGGVEVVIIDPETGNARATRSVHFGGLA